MIQKIKKTLIISQFLFLIFFQNVFAAGDAGQIFFRFENPLTNVRSIPDLIKLFVDWVIQLGVIAATLAFIYVGFQFVAAKGNPEGIKKAKDAFLWTVVGTLVLIASSVLIEVIKSTLTQSGVLTTT